MSCVQWELTDWTLNRKSDRRCGPPRTPMSASLWVQSVARRPYERSAARKEGRKAEGTDKGGNWTNQFTVFEIRLPRPTGPRLSDVQRVQGCACMGRHTPVRTFVNAPLAMPLPNHSTTLILFYCCVRIKDERYPPPPPAYPPFFSLPNARMRKHRDRKRECDRSR